MNPRKHLTGLDDPPRAAIAHLLKGPTTGAINAGKAEDVGGKAGLQPLAFGQHTLMRPDGAGGDWGGFIHPAALMVAINGGGRQIPYPCRLCRAQGIPGHLQERIPTRIGRGRGKDVRCAGKRWSQIGGPKQGLHPRRAQVISAGRIAAGADHGPAQRDQPHRKRAGRVAMAKGKKRVHGRTIATARGGGKA